MTCPHCGETKYIKKGTDRNGKQRVRCANCGKGYGLDGIVDSEKVDNPIHYSKAPDFCPAAKRAVSPLFSDDIDKVNCRICRQRFNKQIKPENLTSNKSFTLTGEAIDLLVNESNVRGVSQSALVNQLILENLSNGN